MKINWGTKIAVLYCGFVVLILVLVIASMRQHFDLVSVNYYADEVAYQQVIDAGKNEAKLSSPITVHANGANVIIELPAELSTKKISGIIQFYSPVNAAWDQKFTAIPSDHIISIARNKLRCTRYTLKIDLTAGGNKYYQETEINLHS
jgi:nitrogen fixation protein FixH